MSVKVRRFTRFSVGVSLSMTGQSPAVSAGVPGTSGHSQVLSDISAVSGAAEASE
ncbi:hypothetical protein ACLB1N_36120 [Escherichia coli]